MDQTKTGVEMREVQAIEVITTIGDEPAARRIAQTLVERRLSACVQIVGPISSIYRWQGKVESSHEWMCVAKTVRALYQSVELAIRGLHPYEEPEIIALPIVDGSHGYLAWLASQVESPTTSL
jgi:periplasmic divalent cation tolerance protein